jgi:hypothetical protein
MGLGPEVKDGRRCEMVPVLWLLDLAYQWGL